MTIHEIHEVSEQPGEDAEERHLGTSASTRCSRRVLRLSGCVSFVGQFGPSRVVPRSLPERRNNAAPTQADRQRFCNSFALSRPQA